MGGTRKKIVQQIYILIKKVNKNDDEVTNIFAN